MKITEYIFWACLLLIAHTYLIYPVALFLAYVLSQIWRDWRYLTGCRDRRVPMPPSEQFPGVTLIVPAYNEQAHLPDKIANLRQTDYPREKFEVVFVSDGSTDRTNEILHALREPNVESIYVPQRRGKSNALNLAVQRARHDILVFSDASTLFAPDAVKNLVRHFSDPSVGVVCGAVRLLQRTAEAEQTEGIYWKYESVLRLMEARLGATLAASGAIYAARRICYRPLAARELIDDFLIPMNARRLGYRVLYDPEALATEFAASSVAAEFTRRVRLAVGSFQALGEFVRITRHSFTSIAFFSHKVLRWIAPFLLMGLLVCSVLLLRGTLYRAALLGQLLFYLWAGIGFALRHRAQRLRFTLMGYFLLTIHVAFLVGFWRYLSRQEDSTWQRVS